MGEFDERTVSEPKNDEFAPQQSEPSTSPEIPVDDAPGSSGPEPTAEPSDGPEGQPAETVGAEPATTPPADESGAELIARIAAEVSPEPAEAPESGSAESETTSVQEQLALDVPMVETGAEPASDADDLEAAIAAASEQVGVEPTLDDIAPGTTHHGEAEAEIEEVVPKYGAPWWPFIVYLVVWLAFAGYGVWQFMQLPAGQVTYESQPYALFVFGGIIMAAVGPILILAVWLGARFSESRHRVGLFSSAFIKGAIITLIGVAVWWGAFLAVDFLRLGRTF